MLDTEHKPRSIEWCPVHHGVLLAMLFASTLAQAVTPTVMLDAFKLGDPFPPPPWRIVQLNEKVPATRYALIEWDGVRAIEAQADASMALFARPLSVDLAATPMLCWRWRVDHVIAQADMDKKSGDDYAARVYIAFSLPAEDLSLADKLKLGFARKIYGTEVPDAAINYVWDNRHAPGTKRPSVYTSRAYMIVQRSGDAAADHWVSERVDVLEDATLAFDSRGLQAVSLAVAADTDNTGSQVRSGFADLHFVARDVACDFKERR